MTISSKHKQSAFNYIELLLVVVLVGGLVLLGYALVLKTKTSSSTTTCMSNLKQLGGAVQMYADVNGAKIPYAFIHYSDKKQVTWDTLITPFLSTNSATGLQVGGAATRDTRKLLSCPSDVIPRLPFAALNGLPPRTYSMSSHTMNELDWPVGPANVTGVGLWWATYGGKYSSLTNVTTSSGIAAIRLSDFLEPTATIVLTEQAKANNIARNSSGARIKSTGEHLEESLIPLAQYHQGKISYLMADMHVETLNPKATVGHTGQAGTNVSLHYGMWTIRARD